MLRKGIIFPHYFPKTDRFQRIIEEKKEKGIASCPFSKGIWHESAAADLATTLRADSKLNFKSCKNISNNILDIQKLCKKIDLKKLGSCNC